MHSFSIAVLFAATLSFTVNAQAERIKVLTTGAFKQVVLELVPGFEARTGNQVTVDNDTAGALIKRVDGGEDFDVLILTPAAIQKYATAGKIAAPTTANLASVGIGVAVKAGAPIPEMKTVAQFRQALLDAKHIAYIDPASGGSSGPYLVTLFGKLGVADQVAPKAVLVNGGVVATKLVSGEADLAIHQISEIMPVKGATLVGPLPDEIQMYTSYAGGVNASSTHRSAADAFMALLASTDAANVIRAKGMRADR